MVSRDDNALYHAIKAYSNAGLHIYDGLVMGVFAKHVWGCPPEKFVDHYRQHITANHADIGVGTGYCLDRCEFGTPRPRLALIDLQKNCLEYSAKRLARFQPETYLRNACEPIRIGARRFDSIALGGLLHCLPGDMRRKGRVFDALAPIARNDATIFVYSLVSDCVRQNIRRRLVHYCLNRLRLINDDDDRAVDLGAELSRRFSDCKLKLIGNVAFFSAVVPVGYSPDVNGP